MSNQRLTVTIRTHLESPGNVIPRPGRKYDLDDIINYQDPDGDAPVYYALRDSDPTYFNWGKDDWDFPLYTDFAAPDGFITATPAEDLFVRANDAPGDATLGIRAFDGRDWSDWVDFTVTTEGTANTPPVVSVADQTVAPGEYVQLSTILTYSDADSDPATKYQLYDSDWGNHYWWVWGSGLVSSTNEGLVRGFVTTESAANIWIKGDKTASERELQIRAWDAEHPGEWDSFVLRTVGPTLTVDNQLVETGGFVTLDSIMQSADVAGGTFDKVEIFDGAGEDNWWVNGSFVDASGGREETDLANIRIYGDAGGASSQTLWIRGHDGAEWSDWDAFELYTFTA